MTIEEFKVIVIHRGIESVKKKERGAELAGGLLGFKRCGKLHTPKDFYNAVSKERAKLHDIRMKLNGSFKFKKSEEYTKQLYICLQIEWTFEMMKVAWDFEKPQRYNFTPLSSRAIIKYGEIVGIATKIDG